jgi:1,4-alpha-glucan branching enzyme
MKADMEAKIITDDDLYFFNEGTHSRMYAKLGAHLTDLGTHFSVWAPNAEAVSVVGPFNDWESGRDTLEPRGTSGIWEGVTGDAPKGTLYKFRIRPRGTSHELEKTDPYGSFYEIAPKTAAIVWGLDYEWGDRAWMEGRAARSDLSAPMSIYEMHVGSWRHVPGKIESFSYREMAEPLADHVERCGFTHVEFLPVTEYPFYGSWGYQATGFFAPTSRFGTPQDFMYLVDYLHQRGIGVILDWVPSHFPQDEWSLGNFDGTHLYEHADPRLGVHADWGSFIFNYGRNEVRSFLLSSALSWLDRYHIDGLRVDAVASMLYLDYSRKEGEWIPNEYGGRENLEAISFLRQFNETVYASYPDVHTIAEESTAWPGVSRPTYVGGLGFGMKWDMGWMHDTLHYFERDPIHRQFHHSNLTFRMLYAFGENFVLPLSHDEVVHGKGSLIGKMPGDDWQKFANLRLLYGYMWGQPAKKLLFMGAELAQWREWAYEEELDWHLLDEDPHAGIVRWLHDLNHVYATEPAMHELDFEPGGFEWVDANDAGNSALTFLRRSRGGDPVLVACNFTPVPRWTYRIGVPEGGTWKEILNSDAEVYGGSGIGNFGSVDSLPIGLHGRPRSITVTLPPLAVVMFKGGGHPRTPGHA